MLSRYAASRLFLLSVVILSVEAPIIQVGKKLSV
jgi:hypothetical protein